MADTVPDQTSQDSESATGEDTGAPAVQSLKDNVFKLANDAGDKAKGVAQDGIARAGGALDEFAQMLRDAAGTVDDKVGDQYGQYAHSAAQAVGNFSQSLQSKTIDDLIEDARNFVSKSPAVAIGTAAAIGFVLARLVKAGLEPPVVSSDSGGADPAPVDPA